MVYGCQDLNFITILSLSVFLISKINLLSWLQAEFRFTASPPPPKKQQQQQQQKLKIGEHKWEAFFSVCSEVLFKIVIWYACI